MRSRNDDVRSCDELIPRREVKNWIEQEHVRHVREVETLGAVLCHQQNLPVQFDKEIGHKMRTRHAPVAMY